MLAQIVLAVFAAPLLAAAVAVPRTIPASQCNPEALQCCDSVKSATQEGVPQLLGLIGIVVDGITAQVGLNCSPISVIGISGSSCAAQPVCCTGESFHSLVSVGCTPINLGL
ncbi:Fruiting body protein SC1 [Hypsizygus marmoreus]|uniref:Hydrophobin n=1 Tax=Hypsizygus marmoreus TaxID=39966 RepID=A0A369K530_HYPMA|nr:Fruiting body protein SC1 [Hypsizygus marmoreus]